MQGWKKAKDWVITIILVVLTVRLGADVVKLWRAGARVKDTEKELAVVQKETEALKKQLAEVQTPEFVEREVRDKLGYGKPGEEILILPLQEESKLTETAGVNNEANWKKWWRLWISD